MPELLVMASLRYTGRVENEPYHLLLPAYFFG
jgi:hypothetical protein